MGTSVGLTTWETPRLWLLLLLLLLLLLFVLPCSCNVKPADMKLPPEEVAVLKKINATLKIGWNFDVNPCSQWNETIDWSPQLDRQTTRRLTCGDCNTTTKFCHVVAIFLKGQNITGELPEEFGELPSLRQLDLSRNRFSGSIPAAAWVKAPLKILNILGNRLTGHLPEDIGQITTLEELILENNLLQGPLPASLGKLTNLTRVLLSSNNFTSMLPETIGNLTKLRDLRIDGNAISGHIPSSIGNLLNLERFDMQGTSLKGPLPFSTLENLTKLRVTDFRGDGKFPPLENMHKIKQLTLRNCSISGKLPGYLGNMSSLEHLDLSFNKFTGKIPDNFANLARNIIYMYLNNNMLNGSIPDWILKSNKNLDLSFNNFTGPRAPTSSKEKPNFVSSYSSQENEKISTYFRKNLPCAEEAKNHNLFINCGGQMENINGIMYEADSHQEGEAIFHISNSKKWAYSSTGHFISGVQEFIKYNSTVLNMSDSKLFESARVSASSLTYFGLCLQKGPYTVNLSFAEIMYTSDETFSSLGRRVFDISIQNQLRKKDFNIAETANGTGRKTLLTFNATVNHSTLEINFRWAGKGTNAIPWRGVYGPLISAISITPNYQVKKGSSRKNQMLLGIIIASCMTILAIVLFLSFWLRKKYLKSSANRKHKGLNLQTCHYGLSQIKLATDNFNPKNKIGEGGFGPVYKGVLPNGTVIAVKKLSSNSSQGSREFVNEIGLISSLLHPNLVKIYGWCNEGNQLLLIYEYMENNSLAWSLFGSKQLQLQLDWETRCKICLGVARGLAYLHTESELKIVHRDIKATNILLDKDQNAKISDFGLARLSEKENSHISTRIAGTWGYMAPEYALRGHLTNKADVYSFGIVMLEVISGTSNIKYTAGEEFECLIDRAYALQAEGKLLELVDPRLGLDYSSSEAQWLLNLALACTNQSPGLRPTISEVVNILEGQMNVLQVPTGMHSSNNIEEPPLGDFSNDETEGIIASTS